LHSTPVGQDKFQKPELPYTNAGDRNRVNRSFTHSSSGKAPRVANPRSATLLKPTLTQDISFDGLNHRQQRLANGGNQFSLEPPDQGLCVGNGKVLEVINDVLQVYDMSGNPLLNGGAAQDLNTFFKYKAAINRTTGRFGQFVTDPSCYYDPTAQRWFLEVLTLDRVATTGAFKGSNHIDLAVSQTSNPIGTWVIYKIPVQDDGTQGTPDHKCPLNNDGTGHGACIGDYPHIGADANGFYITTNEYPFFPTNFQYHAAQIYAISKSALAANAATITVVQYDTKGMVSGKPGFTVWPAESPAGVYDSSQGGTEYFMSSTAAEEAGGVGYSDNIVVWAFINTSSLNSTPALSLFNSALAVGAYTLPPLSDQKAGNFPLGQCLNTDACAFILNGAADPFKLETEMPLDSNDTRMQQVVLANGKLWSALDTGVDLGGVTKAGIEWFVLTPSVTGSAVSASVVSNNYLGVTNNNVTYPAVGVTTGGLGVMAFTLVGADHYPSAAYAPISTGGVGAMQVAMAGAGPEDGFSGYKAEGNPPGTFRPRWGDYGGAVEDGGKIWIASEYIGQSCTLSQYETNTSASPLFSCNKTRTALANWDTRITEVTP
jgi:hypothetical protein